MKRPAFFLTAFFVLFLALIGFSTPAQAARSQQTVPQPTATMTPYVPPAATPTPSATYVSPIPTPGQTRCKINSRAPLVEREDGLSVLISAEGAPGPRWQVVEAVSGSVVDTGTLDSQGRILDDVKVKWDTDYYLQIEWMDAWYSNRACELRFEHPIGNMPKPIISIESRDVKLGETLEVCLTTTDITGYEFLSLQGAITYPQNLELVSYRLGDVPGSDFSMRWSNQPERLEYVGYQLNFLQGEGSLFCMTLRARSVGEDGWYVKFRYNDLASVFMETQTGTMTVVPAPIYLPAVMR